MKASVYPLVLLSALSLGLVIPAKKPIVKTRVYVAALKPLITAELKVNETTVKLKGNSYAEFEVSGDSVAALLKIKLPVAGVNPPSLSIKGGNDLYIGIFLKQSKLFKAVFAMDTVCKTCYAELKAVCKKDVSP